MKIFRLLIVNLTIFSIATLAFAAPAFSLESIRKDVVPSPVVPGQEVEVTLQILGGSATFRKPADIMLVLDVSTSMFWLTYGNPPVYRIESAKSAVTAFVNQTLENLDHVGLVLYGGNIDPKKFAQLGNMTVQHKNEIINKINSAEELSYTSIGNGIDKANQELLSARARPGVAKYIVIATDGLQNVRQNPYQNGIFVPGKTILQTAIDNKITIFGIGISNDATKLVTMVYPDCPDQPNGCVDLDGDGYTSGEEVMRDITDKTGGKYYWAPGDEQLTQIYKDIAKEIASDYWIQMFDSINLDVFQENIHDIDGNPNQIDVTNCTIDDPNFGDAWPVQNQFVDGGRFLILLEAIPLGTTVCIKFKVNVRNDPVGLGSSGTWYDVDGSDRLAVIWDPALGNCDTNGDGQVTPDPELENCWDLMDPLTEIEIQAGSMRVVNPIQPWLKTTGGDVGSIGAIQMQRNPWDLLNPIPFPYNAGYLAISAAAITNFRSDKNWLVPGYSGLSIPPLPTSGVYDTLWGMYSKKGFSDDMQSVLNGFTPAVIWGQSNNVLRYNGDFTISSLFDYYYSNSTKVISITGNLNINNQLSIPQSTSGLIFVVQGNLTIDPAVTQVDGLFIVNGGFDSTASGTCSLGSNNPQLRINGALYIFGEACFTRSLANNLNDPAELINFEPKYLWLFRDIAGSASVIYREVAP